MTISNYQTYQKPTEHLKTEAEKAWYWAKPVLFWGVLPTSTIFLILFSILPADWQTWEAVPFIGLMAVGIALYYNVSIFFDSIFVFVYAITSLIKFENKFALALACLLISLLMLSLPLVIVTGSIISFFK